MGAFSDIEDTPRDSGLSRRPFLTEGDYVIEVEKYQERVSANPESKHNGEDMVIMEGTILDVTRNVEGVSLKPGSQFVVINIIERDRKGALTQTGKRNLGRVKSQVAALLGGVEDALITGAACTKLASGTGEAVKGVRLVVQASDSKSPTTGKTFTNLKWAPLQ